jgi:quercetin dioxygenase-like cupin family protein
MGTCSVPTVSFSLLSATDAQWRPSNLTQVLNTDLAKQLGATNLRARMWRLAPGQTLTRHRHLEAHELYVVIEGTGRIRIDRQSLTLDPLSAVLVEPSTVRQVFNDTDVDALWLVVGAPPDSWEMTPELLATVYPDGPEALPPELGGTEPAAPQP